MAKRLANVFFIALGVMLACVAVFALVLFLAPGLSIFGIKYIAKGTHIVNKSVYISEEVAGFSGSIRIETDDVPVEVVFSQKFAYQIEYYDNYCGLTSSKFDDPNFECTKESDGTAVIKIKSFKKFIYENNNSTRYIKVLIPSTIVGATRQWQTDLSIVSKNSNVTFVDEVDDNYDPKFKNLEIETSGEISTLTSVFAQNYSLKTINAIKIGENAVSNINATNYILNSTGGKIVVDRDVSGDITATTKDARIQLLSCQNLVVNSGFGDIYSARADVGVVVQGSANISTTAGLVRIDSILGMSQKSVIKTTSGNVQIAKVYDLDLTTTRGFVRIASARNANVATSSGSIVVEAATESVSAKSKRGKITLGGEQAVLKNPKAESTYGDIYVCSASGTASILTSKSNVTFINKDAGSIKIVSGKDLTASKLGGVVDIEVGGNAAIDFENFTAKTNIAGVGANSQITINLLNNDNTTFSYNLEGNDVSLFEYNVDDPENHYQIGKSTSLTSSPEQVGLPLLKAKTTGVLVVYYKKAA